jgi:hypothetical protein
MISVGKKPFAKKEQREHGIFSGLPRVVDAPLKKKAAVFVTGYGHDKLCPPNRR